MASLQGGWHFFRWLGRKLPRQAQGTGIGEDSGWDSRRSEANSTSALCNLNSVTKSQQAVRDLVKAMRDLTGNMPSLPAIFPNGRVPVVRTARDGCVSCK
jgi:hypothetical protein